MDERPSCGYHLTKPTVMWDHFGTTCLQPMKLLKVGKVLKTIENVLCATKRESEAVKNDPSQEHD